MLRSRSTLSCEFCWGNLTISYTLLSLEIALQLGSSVFSGGMSCGCQYTFYVLTSGLLDMAWLSCRLWNVHVITGVTLSPSTDLIYLLAIVQITKPNLDTDQGWRHNPSPLTPERDVSDGLWMEYSYGCDRLSCSPCARTMIEISLHTRNSYKTRTKSHQKLLIANPGQTSSLINSIHLKEAIPPLPS